MTNDARKTSNAVLASVLAFAALNAISFFCRSDSSLLLGDATNCERIGFPSIVWERFDRGVGRFYAPALVLNVVVGLIVSGLLGMAFAYARRRNRLPAERIRACAGPTRAQGCWRLVPQFSLYELLLFTAGVAILLALNQRTDEQTKQKMLMASYWLGPLGVVAAYFLTARQQEGARIRMTIGAAVLMASASLIRGASAGIADTTHIALGLFVYWTPQCVAIIGGVGAWQMLRTTTSSPAESRD